MLTFDPKKRIVARDALRMPFFTVTPTAACPDFRNQFSLFSQLPSTSLPHPDNSSTTLHHTHMRNSLRVAGRNSSARPFIPSRHSLRPMLQRTSHLKTPGPSGETIETIHTAPSEPTKLAANALSVDVEFNPPRPVQLARITGRRYTQPVRPRVSRFPTRAPPIPEVSSHETSPPKLEGYLMPQQPVVTSEDSTSSDAIRARPKKTARRRTVTGVEQVCSIPHFT